MRAGQPRRVYLDTMILAYHLGSPSGAAVLNRNLNFLTKISARQVVGIVSTFTVAECISVLAKAHAERNGTAPTLVQLAQAKEKIEQFIRSMGIELEDSDALCFDPNGNVNVFARTVQLELTSPPALGRDRKWRTFGGADVLHVIFAERSDADDFATFDEGFRNMNSQVVPVLL